jgi:hypothetical protein
MSVFGSRSSITNDGNQLVTSVDNQRAIKQLEMSNKIQTGLELKIDALKKEISKLKIIYLLFCSRGKTLLHKFIDGGFWIFNHIVSEKKSITLIGQRRHHDITSNDLKKWFRSHVRGKEGSHQIRTLRKG